ncbi:MAG: YajQ family cyclic di-GMP-binding protein [Bdellovibrionales bacterium]|nr:YajQ family cyclic di-GMP-binding protein [Bdellovibrionales bacterium]
MPSFDVVSKVDMQEVDNAVNQAIKEVQTRYDFRNSKSSIEFNKEVIVLHADDKMKLKALQEILNQKMTKRGVGVRSLDYKDPEEATMGSLRQRVEIKQGISQDDAKKIVKRIKDENLKKVQAQIQQDQVRVTGPKRDDLQQVISLLKEAIPLELQFVNFKD